MLPERTDPPGSLSRPPVPSGASVRALRSSVEARPHSSTPGAGDCAENGCGGSVCFGPFFCSPVLRARGHLPRRCFRGRALPGRYSSSGTGQRCERRHGPADGQMRPWRRRGCRCWFGPEGARRDDAGRPGGGRQVPLGEGTSGPFGFRVGSPPTRRDDRPGPGIPRSPPREGGPVQGARAAAAAARAGPAAAQAGPVAARIGPTATQAGPAVARAGLAKARAGPAWTGSGSG